MLPLYKNNNASKSYNRNGNAGLWYDKFCNKWRWDDGILSLKAIKDITPKLEWIKTIAGGNAKIGNSQFIEETLDRRMEMVASLIGEVRVFATDWRFVTGLGKDHPIEVGFAWHHTLGVPYLPGTSVKGIVRAWARLCGEGSDQKAAINRIFGPDSEAKDKGGVGSVIFFDALPLSPIALEVDVMTPHYSDYYKDDQKSPPSDWMSPEPIQFLTVSEGQEFFFAFAPRTPNNKEVVKDVETVAGWLEDALSWIGAGAKTAVGYGRFKRRVDKEKWLLKKQKEKEEEARWKREIASMGAIRREMEDDGYSTDEQKFMESMAIKWLGKMELAETSGEDKIEIATLLVEWYKKYRPKQWKKPRGKNKEKIDRMKKVLKNV